MGDQMSQHEKGLAPEGQSTPLPLQHTRGLPEHEGAEAVKHAAGTPDWVCPAHPGGLRRAAAVGSAESIEFARGESRPASRAESPPRPSFHSIFVRAERNSLGQAPVWAQRRDYPWNSNTLRNPRPG